MNEGLIVLDKDQIQYTDVQSVQIKTSVPYVDVFSVTKENYDILKQLHPDKEILTVQFQIIPNICLDMTSYEYVKYTYNVLKQKGFEAKDDNALIALATTEMSPNKTMVIFYQEMGPTAFDNSKVYQYRIKCIRCYDLTKLSNLKVYAI